jgi:RNA polymerase sigma-70 factor (ECF subfamily)
VQSAIKFLDGNYRKLSNEELLLHIQGGNVAAFNELFHRYSKRLYFYLFKMLSGDEEKAKDFLQELFLKIIEKGHYFDSKRSFSTWVYKIATNMCLNAYKAQKIRAAKINEQIRYPPVDGTNKIIEEIDQRIDRENFNKLLTRQLNRINPVSKSIFLLRFQENLSIREISKIVSLPEGTVKSRLFYTIKKLAHQLHHFNQLI